MYFLDTESTGLSSDSQIIEIGVLETEGSDLRSTGAVYHRYFNPTIDVSRESVAVHGMDKSFLMRYPTIEPTDIMDLLSFIGNGTVVIHNSVFDLSLIDNQMDRLGFNIWFSSLYVNRLVDTLPVARQSIKARSHSLDSLCRYFAIDNSARQEFHTALVDAEILRQVSVALKITPVDVSDSLLIFPHDLPQGVSCVGRPLTTKHKVQRLL